MRRILKKIACDGVN